MDFSPFISTFEQFKDQLNGTTNIQTGISNSTQKFVKIQKNLVLFYKSDDSGCGHVRSILPAMYLNSVFGKSGQLRPVVLPFFVFQPEILVYTRSIFFQRTMNPAQLPLVQKYKELQSQFQYKMIYDIDDFIFKGDDPGEDIPDYNFGKKTISDEVRKTAIEIMNLMDVVCVSTEFLGDYIKNKCGVKTPIKVVPNSVPMYFYGPRQRAPITEKIKVPKVIWTGSPTHYMDSNYVEKNGQKITVFPVYSEDRKTISYYRDEKGIEKYNPSDVKKNQQKGDLDNAWCEWIIKSVKDKKIRFLMMGTNHIPFFFKELEGNENFKIIGWLNTFQYNMPILDYQPDIGIAPLVSNFFNRSKSDIKSIEYMAAGCLSIGTVFSDGTPSPYDNNFVKAPDNITVEEIDELIDKYTEPDIYNDIIRKQYQYLHENGRYLESAKFVNYLGSIL
ncbi:MAG TPA: hypothetical protein PLI22_02330 [Caldisericia bacterium]|nr:hypothetical protein [Caldisericia bacterium]